MSNMSGAGLPQLVQEIKLASENIRKSDDANREKLEDLESRYASLETSVNDLFKHWPTRRLRRSQRHPRAERRRRDGDRQAQLGRSQDRNH